MKRSNPFSSHKVRSFYINGEPSVCFINWDKLVGIEYPGLPIGEMGVVDVEVLTCMELQR